MGEEHYPCRVFWSEGDQEFVAVCDELGGISALGSTREEAVRQINIAIEMALEIYREENPE